MTADNPLARARVGAGLTIDDLATAAGVAKNTIWRYENGLTARRSRPFMRAMAEVLKIDAATLIADLAAWQATSVQPASDAGVRGTK